MGAHFSSSQNSFQYIKKKKKKFIPIHINITKRKKKGIFLEEGHPIFWLINFLTFVFDKDMTRTESVGVAINNASPELII
jgi:hypothetical protein